MIDLSDTVDSFDEVRYLQLNPDVAEAVRNKQFCSGWQHYIIYGIHENRRGVPPEVYSRLAEIILVPDDPTKFDSESVPPADLRTRVHGSRDVLSFEHIGKQIASDIHGSIKMTIELNEHSRILDFGCGCGRVIRYFKSLCDSARFYGIDIDDVAISWCQSHLAKIADFSPNEQSPPLVFKNDFFDLIYCISVFTHLPEDMQFLWLEELARVTKPGGYLLLTVHGEELLNFEGKCKEQLQELGFFYFVGPGAEGLPDFYGTSFHTEHYIRRCWSRFFDIEQITKKGVANHQDLILCRKAV